MSAPADLSTLTLDQLTELLRGGVVQGFGQGAAVVRVISRPMVDGAHWRMRALYDDGSERDLFVRRPRME